MEIKSNENIESKSFKSTIISKRDIIKNHFNTIYTLDAPCGAGKTYNFIHEISLGYHESKNIIVVQAHVLAEEIKSRFPTHCNVRIVNSYTIADKASVKTHINTAIQDINNIGHGTLIITGVSYISLQKNIHILDGKSDWNLFIDEIPSVQEHMFLTAPRQHKIVTDFIELDEDIDEFWSSVKLKDRESALLFCNRNNKKRDDVESFTHKLLEHLLYYGNAITYRKSFNGVINNKGMENDSFHRKSDSNPTTTLYFTLFLGHGIFCGYKSTTIMGANFKKSFLSSIFDSKSTFKVSPLQSKLRYQEHAENTNKRLHIHFLQYDSNSKTKLTSNVDGISLLETHIRKVKNLVGSDECIFTANNKLIEELKIDVSKIAPNFKKIPVVCRGIDSLQHIHHVAVLPALNLSKMYKSSLYAVGIYDTSTIQSENAYQTIMRSSLRNINSKETVHAYVVSEMEAINVAEMFPGATVHSPDGKIFNVVKNKKIEPPRNKILSVLKELNDSVIDNLGEDNFIFRLYTSKYDKECSSVSVTNIQDFISELKKLNTNNAVLSKEKNMLVNYAYSDEGGRTKEDIDMVSPVIALDIEDGDMSIKVCRRILQETLKVTHCIYETMSSTKEKPRYRVLIFTDQSMTVEAHRHLYLHIIDVFKKEKFWTKPHNQTYDEYKIQFPSRKLSGIDISKISAASIFYLPGHLVGESKKHFEAWGYKANEIHRRLLKVSDILERTNFVPEERNVVLIEAKVEEKVDQTALIKKCENLIESMIPGNRSYIATVLAGNMKNVNDFSEKNRLADLAIAKGIDDKAVKMMKKYANLRI